MGLSSVNYSYQIVELIHPNSVICYRCIPRHSNCLADCIARSRSVLGFGLANDSIFFHDSDVEEVDPSVTTAL